MLLFYRVRGRLPRPMDSSATDPKHQISDGVGVLITATPADGFALLAISRASLADLNARLSVPLSMDRFRPNLVLDDLPPYGEDALQEFGAGEVRLRAVKPCTRCVVTTTDQATGKPMGQEPLRTLKTYRWDKRLRGVTFGQNVIVLSGRGAELRRGQPLQEYRVF